MSAADLPSDFFNRPLSEVDPEIAEVLGLELERQQRTQPLAGRQMRLLGADQVVHRLRSRSGTKATSSGPT